MNLRRLYHRGTSSAGRHLRCTAAKQAGPQPARPDGQRKAGQGRAAQPRKAAVWKPTACMKMNLQGESTSCLSRAAARWARPYLEIEKSLLRALRENPSAAARS